MSAIETYNKRHAEAIKNAMDARAAGSLDAMLNYFKAANAWRTLYVTEFNRLGGSVEY